MLCLRVALQHRGAEIEGDHLRGQVLRVQPLDHRVVPVQLVEQRRRRSTHALRPARADQVVIAFVATQAARVAVARVARGRCDRAGRCDRRQDAIALVALAVPIRTIGALGSVRPIVAIERAFAALEAITSLAGPQRRRAATAELVELLFDDLHQQVLAPIEIRRDERVAVGNQVANAHPRRVRVTQRLSDVAAQRHGVGELRRDREQRQQVAVTQRFLKAVAVEIEDLDEACGGLLGRVDSFELHAVRIREHRRAARITQHFAQRLVARLQFIDRRRVDRAMHRDPRPGRMEHDDVAGGQLHVLRLVALNQKLVDVELGDDLPVASQSDLAHRSVRPRPAGRHDRRQQRRLARQRIDAGTLRRPDDEYLHRAQLAERHVEVEVGVQAPDLRAQMALEVGGLDAGHREAADARQVQQAVAIDRGAVVDVDRAPCTDQHLVARPDDVVSRHGHIVDRCEAVQRIGKEAGAEVGQQATGRCFDEALELARYRRRHLAAQTHLRHRAVAPDAVAERRTQGRRAVGHRAHRTASGRHPAVGLLSTARHAGRDVARRVEGSARCRLFVDLRIRSANRQTQQQPERTGTKAEHCHVSADVQVGLRARMHRTGRRRPKSRGRRRSTLAIQTGW